MASKKDFLEQKAINFRDYLLKYKPAPEIQTYIHSFHRDKLIMTLLAVVVPIVKSNTTASAISDLMKKLTVPESEVPEVADKLKRYLEMFASVVLSDA